VSGAVPLTPIQRWFFGRGLPEPPHFNQAVLLEVSPLPDPERIGQAVEHLIAHHDALRHRFTQTPSGWTQAVEAPDGAVPFGHHDLSALAQAEQRAAIEATASDLQRSLNLEDGPLLRAASFDLGADRAGRLLLVIHHLVVDGVSWRILLEDLLSLLTQLGRNEDPVLPLKTTSFRRWAEVLAEHANSSAMAEEASYWLAGDAMSTSATPLPVDCGTEGDADPGSEGAAGKVSLALEAEATRMLVEELPRAQGAQAEEALLTALALAVAEWSGQEVVGVDLEGHGREEALVGDRVDLSRTVGWFTTYCPVGLHLGPASGRDPGAMLQAVKEQLRGIPHRGIGHGLLRWLRDEHEHEAEGERIASLRQQPVPALAFNYMGQLDSALPADCGARPAWEAIGPMRSPEGTRGHLLEVEASVIGGRLLVDWIHNPRVHRPETIAALANRFLETLQRLIAACRQPEGRADAPVGSPLAGLDAAAWEALTAGQPAIEDVYPMTPVQEGMLFHSLFDPTGGVYIQQFTCVLRGVLNRGAFDRAWGTIVARHGVLRTAFPAVGGDRSMQVVYRDAVLPIDAHDWRGLAPGEQAGRLDAFLEEDRRRGFDPARAPLMRLALLRLEDEAYQLVWSCHHALMDGWCQPLLLQEVLVGYEAFAQGKAPALPSCRPYRDYIAWLQEYDDSRAEAYWRSTLAGFRAATPLPMGLPGAGAPAGHGERRCRLTQAATAALQAEARKNRLTVNTLVQGAWAVLLSRYGGRSDVVFGATVSGRPAELSGVESMVGLFINTLPVRVSVAEQATLSEWLGALQEAQAEQRQCEATPLVEIQGYSEVPRGQPLFESLLVFENYPIDTSLPSRAGRLGVSDVRALERTSYPLALTVVPGAELSLRLDYDVGRFDPATIERVLGHLRTLLEGLGAGLGRRLEELAMLTAAEQDELVRLGHGTRLEPSALLAEDASRLLTEVDRLSEQELDSLLGSLLLDSREVGNEPYPERDHPSEHRTEACPAGTPDP
jgi:non-ribosomal peptide synthase protein (TIGR01720 family)